MNRRDFLLLRAGHPPLLSCEQLFMRYLDSQIAGDTARLFDELAADLRQVNAVRLTDTSWRACAAFNVHLERVLEVFTASGSRLES
jgi:hypothetical protein